MCKQLIDNISYIVKSQLLTYFYQKYQTLLLKTLSTFKPMSSAKGLLQTRIFGSIRSQLIFFSAVFTASLVLIPLVIYVQSTENAKAAQKIEEVRLPISLLTTKLLTETTNASAAQRAYIITKEIQYKQDRQKIWTESIYPLVDSLERFRKELQNTAIDSTFAQALLLLKKYDKFQIEIDEFFEENIEAFDNTIIQRTDTVASAELFTVISKRNQLNIALNEMIGEKATRQRQNIEALLVPLIQNQEAQLQAEIQTVGKNIRFSILIVFLISIALVFGVIIFSYFIITNLQKSIRKPIDLITKLAKGRAVESNELVNNELDEVILASNKLSQNLKKASEFAQNIGEANFEVDFQLEDEQDVLGNALLQMRQKLKKFSEEDRQRNWISQGLTRFGDIIRTNSQNFEQLGDVFLSELIEYIGANQGGVFIVRQEDDTHSEYIATLELIAYYAYQRKKYLNRLLKIHPYYAENLVGQCFLEQEKIYLKEIPENYINITSGLGDAPPSHVLLVPFKVNNAVEAVIELASFQPFEPHHIEFVETIGETFAATVTTVKANERTQLLLSNLQEKTESLQAQEEEMRQNMEELTVTQEQMRLKQNELENLKANLEIEVNRRTQELNESLTRFNLINQASSEGLWDMLVPPSGIISEDTYFYWSPQLKTSLGYNDKEFPNKVASWLSVLHPEDSERISKAFITFLKDKSGKLNFYEEHRLRLKNGNYEWFVAAAHALRDNKGNALRIAGYINNITDSKELEKVLQELRVQKETLEQKQVELEAANKKMVNNELVLRKALERNREKEKEIAKKTQTLIQNQQRFDMLTQNVPGVLYEFEANLGTQEAKYTFVTSYVSQILGYSTQEFIDKNMQQLQALIHNADNDSFQRNYFKALKQISAFEWEGRMQAKDKSWKWVKVNAKPYQEEDKVVFFGIITDITLKKQQEDRLLRLNENLKKSENELRTNLLKLHKTQQEMELKNKTLEEMNQRIQGNEKVLIKALQKVKEKEQQINHKNYEMQGILDASLDAIFTIDKEGTIQTTNAVAYQVFGYTQEELIGKNISMLMPEPDKSEHSLYLQNYQQTGTKKVINRNRPIKAVRKDGTEFVALIAVSEIKIQNTILYVGFVREVKNVQR